MRISKNWILIAIVALGAAVRFWGLAFCLSFGTGDYVVVPYCRLDEELIWKAALGFFSGDLNPHFFTYPTLLPYSLALLDAIYLAGKFLLEARGSVEALKQNIVMNPSDLVLLGRGWVALLGSATLILVYQMAKKLFDGATGLLSAFFLAFAYLHVRDSHFATTDIPMTFMVCAAYLFIIRILQRGAWPDYLLAGFFSGLAISTKWNALPVIFPILLADVLRLRKESDPERAILNVKLFASLAIVPLAVILGTPSLLFSPHECIESLRALARIHARKYVLPGISHLNGPVYHFKFTLWYGLGWPLFLASLAGIGVVLKKNWKAGLLLLGFVLPYYFIISRRDLVFMRYMIPVIPFCAIFAGVLVAPLKKWSIGLMLIFSFLIMTPSIYRILQLDRQLTKADSRILAGRWIRENIPANASLLLLSLISGDPAIPLQEAKFWDLDIPLRVEWPLKFFKTKLSVDVYRPERVIPDMYWQKRNNLAAGKYDFLIADDSPLPVRSITPEMLADLKERFVLVREFRGVGDHPGMIFDWQHGFYVPVAGAQFAERPGPNIYIFRKK